MLNLNYANQIEALIEPLVNLIDFNQKQKPLQSIDVITPNPSIAHYVRFQISQQLGVCANINFPYLRRYLIDKIEEADPNIQILQAESLQLLIYKRLTNSDVLQHIHLEPIRTYLDIAESLEERQMRCIQLSGQIAKLFEEYGYSRRKMIKNWLESKNTLDKTQWARAERWQRVLWQSIFDEDGTVKLSEINAVQKKQALLFQQDEDLDKKKKKVAKGHRWMFLPEAIKLTIDKIHLPDEIHIFGLSYVAPAFSEILGQLSSKTEMHMYVLNPCCEFWEDVDNRLNIAREGWVSRSLRIKNLDDAIDPFDLDNLQDSPPLRLWGRPGREYIRTLNQITDCSYNSLFIDPLSGQFTLNTQDHLNYLSDDHPEEMASILKKLQRDILFRKPSPPLLDEQIEDQSIRLIAAPGLRREVEIVADEIWKLIKTSESTGEHIRFHDIAVLVTEAHKQTYFTYIESIFRERYKLPFNMLDRHISAQSRVLEALIRLLELPLTDLSASSLMSVISHPLIGGGLEHADPELWHRWVQQLKIRFGANAQALKDTYVDRDIYHWDQGLKRLVLGAFLKGERSGDDHIYQIGDQTWLPYESSIGSISDVSQFVHLARKLIMDCLQNQQEKRPLKDWAKYFLRLMNTYIIPKSPSDEQVMSRCIEVLDELAQADLEGSHLPYHVAQSLFKNKLKDLESRRGQHLADGLVVSSLHPMRAIPFHTIFILGLGEQDFPAKTVQDPLDLRQAKQLIGDVSPPQKDRYLFLESILSARKNLILSYVALDDKTGDPLEPSAVVRELQFILKSYLGPQGLKPMIHPLSPFDLFYDPEHQPNAISKPSDDVINAIQAVKLRKSMNAFVANKQLSKTEINSAMMNWNYPKLNEFLGINKENVQNAPKEKKIKITLSRLRAFLYSPLQGSAQAVLKLHHDQHTLDDRLLTHPLHMDYFIHQELLENAFWGGNGKTNEVMAYYDHLYEKALLKGQAPVGFFSKEQKRRDQMILSRWISNLGQMNLMPLELWQHIHIGESDEFEKLHLRLPPIRLTIQGVNGDLEHEIEITGRLPPIQPDFKACLSLVHGKSMGEHLFINGFLTMVALSSSHQPLSKEFRAILNPHDDFDITKIKQSYYIPTPNMSKDWLSVMATYLTAFIPYRFPIKSVLEWRKQLTKDSTAPFKIIHNDYERGPVSNIEDFPIPPHQVALQMIRTFYGPWFQSQILT